MAEKKDKSREKNGKTAIPDIVVEEFNEEDLDELVEPEQTEPQEPVAESGAGEPEEDGGEATADGQEGESAPEEPQKKSGRKKKDKKDEMIEELNDKLRRQMAEFDNFRKRTEKEKVQMYDMGAKNIIEKILPVIDNFERGLAGVPEEAREDAFVVGMDKVYRQMLTELEAIGVTAIAAVGEEFNPDFHNAVMQVESEEYGSGVVAQELQKGYLYKDSVVRHSMVAVVQ